MASDHRGFTSEELANVLKKLDDVLGEAERVRRDVTRQLSTRARERPTAHDQPPARPSRKRR
jgi:hypothetical protein